MTSARNPEAIVWTDNEVELLLRVTLDYKVSKFQETRTKAVVRHCYWRCCYETSRGSAGWGDAVIILESMQIRHPHENGRAVFFHPETRFQKSVLSGSVWTVGQNDAIRVRFHKKTQKSVFVWTAS